MASVSNGRQGLTGTEWLICVIASIGFAFDIYELLMLPLILRPASSLGSCWASVRIPRHSTGRGLLFFVPALFGGIFGLLGGYLTDLLGRRRVLTWSILLYAFSAFAAGFHVESAMLLILRCTTFIGVCVEFVAAVAWLAELFPDPKQRERVLGYTQAFSSLGGMLVTGAYWLALRSATASTHSWPARGLALDTDLGCDSRVPADNHPAVLARVASLAEEKGRRHAQTAEVSRIVPAAFRRTTIVTAIMFACSYGAAFGAIQHLPQIVPVCPGVRELSRPEHRKSSATCSSFRSSAD